MKKSSMPLRAGTTEAMAKICLEASDHSRSPIHEVGFFYVLMSPEGPARKNLNSPSSIFLSPNIMLTVILKENRSL